MGVQFVFNYEKRVAVAIKIIKTIKIIEDSNVRESLHKVLLQKKHSCNFSAHAAFLKRDIEHPRITILLFDSETNFKHQCTY